MTMRNSRGRNDTGREQKTKTQIISTVVIVALMLLSAMGSAGVVLLFVIGVLAFIAGVMYFIFKAQGTDVDTIGRNIMHNVRTGDKKENEQVFKEARARQRGILSHKEYEMLDKCSHRESLKSLLEAGIIDRSEYLERMHELDCSSAH